MSGILQEVETPCPRRSRGSRTSNESGSGSDPFDSLWDDSTGDYDDTRNIDFTTEIKAPMLTAAKPKRRVKRTTSFTIHSGNEQPAQSSVRPKRDIKPAISTSHKTSLLAQPAQRFRPRVSFAPSPLKHSQQRDKIEPTKRSTRPVAQRNNDLLKRISGEGDEALAREALKKDVRRDTVYLPPEDTTMASVFMGLFSPLKSNPDNYTSGDTEVGSLEARIARKRQAKKTAASSPGRVPLQPSSKIAQETCNKVDVPGKNGGKENIPPGMTLVDIKEKALSNKPTNPGLSLSKLSGNTLARVDVTKPIAARTVNKPVKRVDSQPTLKKSVSPTGRGQSLNSRPRNQAMKASTVSSFARTSRSGMSSTSGRSLRDLNREYPLVSEKITNPAMYDGNWLPHQEVILTQLINGLFGQTNSSAVNDPATLRHDLLQLYQGQFFTTLHKRLQASLLYGTLSIPQDVHRKNSQLRQDLGMKRKFIDIWLQTYEPNALRAALEAVIGRMIPPNKTSSSSLKTSATDPSIQKKALTKRLAKTLDAFLIQNQDMDQESEPGANHDVLPDAYRRTVLRSILIVILLDEARKSLKTYSIRSLFLTSSPYKSSAAVLQALGRFLLPSCGDVGKAVAQLDVQLTYEQHPLEEYEYEITNLAVDLRDGVRLTRIVELLLYPSTPALKDAPYTTFGTSSASSDDSQWPLSASLKFPCLGRAVKVFNVKTALDALASTKEGQQLVTPVRAAEIVDGHREKTIALLWGLFSYWGLSGLVDMKDLRKELDQLRKRAAISQESALYTASEISDNYEPAVLLKEWATIVALLRGAHPENLTTNLASGQFYECILDEYESYILPSTQDSISVGSKTSLEDRLRALGCSAQFIKIVSPSSKPNIFDDSSTTGALAFLCSRLLSGTKRVRAATVLQKAWRAILDQRMEMKRTMARDVARQCAAVVQTRDRILWAKGVIVHWWRANRARKTRKRRTTIASTKTKTMTRTTSKLRIPARKSVKVPLR
ncbi:putative calmodulin-binding protein Sha1 [Aspergillus undulatus]|uniref:putative calmodulin-binding protein Sha1 n=1 Tax=Aspergillus undulatus TaxID=1810928 RepID=UPI003CCDD542